MKVSLIYGKTVESTAGKTGYVIGVNEADGKLVSLTCADENEKVFYIDMDSVKSVKAKIIFRECCTKPYGNPVRLGRPVFDCEGNYAGKLTDLTTEKNKLTFAYIGKKKLSTCDLVLGDAVIIKNTARILKSDVKKNGKVIIRRGTLVTDEVLSRAQKHGEYVQTNLKTI